MQEQKPGSCEVINLKPVQGIDEILSNLLCFKVLILYSFLIGFHQKSGWNSQETHNNEDRSPTLFAEMPHNQAYKKMYFALFFHHCKEVHIHL